MEGGDAADSKDEDGDEECEEDERMQFVIAHDGTSLMYTHTSIFLKPTPALNSCLPVFHCHPPRRTCVTLIPVPSDTQKQRHILPATIIFTSTVSCQRACRSHQDCASEYGLTHVGPSCSAANSPQSSSANSTAARSRIFGGPTAVCSYCAHCSSLHRIRLDAQYRSCINVHQCFPPCSRPDCRRAWSPCEIQDCMREGAGGASPRSLTTQSGSSRSEGRGRQGARLG
jgi:hypothetical protein